MTNPFRSRRRIDARKMMVFIEGYTETHGRPPSHREIAAAMGNRSTSAIRYQLNKLEREGKIEQTRGEYRSVKVAE